MKTEFTRHEVETILKETKIDFCTYGVIGIDYKEGTLYAFIDEETLELQDMVTMYHQYMKDVPQWQKSIVKNHLINEYRKQ